VEDRRFLSAVAEKIASEVERQLIRMLGRRRVRSIEVLVELTESEVKLEADVGVSSLVQDEELQKALNTALDYGIRLADVVLQGIRSGEIRSEEEVGEYIKRKFNDIDP